MQKSVRRSLKAKRKDPKKKAKKKPVALRMAAIEFRSAYQIKGRALRVCVCVCVCVCSFWTMRRIYRRVFFLFSSISFLFFSFKVRNRGFFLLQQQSFAVYRVFFLLLYRVFFFTSISPPLPLISHDPKQPVRLLLEDDVVCVFVSLLGLFVSASRLVPETSVSSRSSHPNRII